MTDNCENSCEVSCHNVFAMVHVNYLIAGGTRVMWELTAEFADPLPHTFQLQFGQTGNHDADDWQDVGIPVTDAYYAVDPDQRVFGKVNTSHYRVKLTTDKGVYYSDPTGVYGVLSARDWRIARETVRQYNVLHRLTSTEGYLLKRRHFGPACNNCLDYQTGEVRQPDCPVCYGTGFQCGYFYPLGCVYALLSPESHRLEQDNSGSFGTRGDIEVQATMLMLPLLEEYDVWVNAKADRRYTIHRIQHIAEVRGTVPVLARVALRPLPFTHVIYDIEIPDQLLGGY